jgi:hypothetical protein
MFHLSIFYHSINAEPPFSYINQPDAADVETDKENAPAPNKPPIDRVYVDSNEPFFIRICKFIGYTLYYALPLKSIRYHAYRISSICKIFKYSRFNLLHYLIDAPNKKSFNAKKPSAFPKYLSAVAIVKNEALYIEEWLEYHLLLGIQKFYIYDNESSDNLPEILQPYVRDGIVEYKYFPGSEKQVAAYNDVLQKAKQETYWLAAIDIDEFIVPVKDETIAGFLKDFEQYAGVEINWLMYGSSGERHWRDRLVIERFKKHGKIDARFWGRGIIKTICNPRSVFKMNVHTPFYFRFAKAVNPDKKVRKCHYKDVKSLYDKIRINHYFTKSYDECQLKYKRGRSDMKGKHDPLIFEYGDINDEYDELMDRYIPLVSENIRKRRGQKETHPQTQSSP